MDHSHHHHNHEQHERQKDPHAEHKQKDVKPKHDEHAGHHTHDFLKRFWICVALTIPVLLLSHMIQQWVGFQISFRGDKWILLVLSTAIFVYGGQPFLKGLVNELRAQSPGMMTLIAVAITTAYVYSVAVIFGLSGMDFLARDEIADGSVTRAGNPCSAYAIGSAC
jgi:P-type Cu2+ transporter